jgi:hypothetical protein
MSMNEQQKRMASAQSAAANATTPETKSRADEKLVGIICEKPRRG